MADKTWTRTEINSLLLTSDRAVERAILRLFELQTEDEQSAANTNHQNGRGFASCDARAGTRFARWLQGMDDSNRVRYAKKSLSHPRDFEDISFSIAARETLNSSF